MSDKKVHEVGEEIAHDPLQKVQSFWQKFQKPVLGVVIAAAVVGGGLYYYKNNCYSLHCHQIFAIVIIFKPCFTYY